MTTTTTPVIELVDPTTLLVDRNIRTHLHLDKALIGSIKENGVLVPITVVRDSDGLRVRAGHRRTAAAIQAGLTEVPVVVMADEDHAHAAQAARIVGQIVENHHRRAVDDTDTVAAVAQLAAFGVSAASIARRAKLPKATVVAAQAVAASDAARTAMDDHAELTLTQAAWIAEFDDDDHAQARILDQIDRGPGMVEHLVQRLRDDRDHAAARTAAAQQIGGTVIEPPTWDNPTAIALERLTDTPPQQWTDGGLGDPIHLDAHRDCPGHVSWLRQVWYATDEQDDPNPIVVDGYTFAAAHGCTQPDRHHARSRVTTSTPNAHGDPVPVGETDDDRAERERTQRRRVIALNRAGDAAMTVRSQWLTAFSQRKTSPKDAPVFLLAALIGRDRPLGDVIADGLYPLRQALGSDDLAALATTPARAAHLHLCAVLWAHEADTKRDTWRYHQPHHTRYLQQLARWGYQLSEVEHVIIGDLTDQAAYEAITP